MQDIQHTQLTTPYKSTKSKETVKRREYRYWEKMKMWNIKDKRLEYHLGTV